MTDKIGDRGKFNAPNGERTYFDADENGNIRNYSAGVGFDQTVTDDAVLVDRTAADEGEGVARLEAEDHRELERLTELGAAIAHDDQWKGWMDYMFSKGAFNDDGSFTINADSVVRWRRQAATPYSQLPESEKESDRVEARKYLALCGWPV